MSAKKENRGGARPNSGPKRSTLSVRQVRQLRKAAKARAKQEGKSLADIVLDIAYDESESVRNRLAAVKLYWEKMMAKVAEDNEMNRVLGPVIYLPQLLPKVDAEKAEGD